jgi:VWFA-related protein
VATRIAIAVAAACVCAQALGAQQAPQPTFRSGVELVELDAIVTDGAGNVVRDLTADDFEIVEAGRRQSIATFSLVDIPIERAERPLFSPTAIEPDVQTNDVPEGRLYVIALDEVAPANALRTRLFLRRFIEQHLGTNDLAAVVLLGRGRRSDAQDFTSNRRLLIEAIGKFSGFPLDMPVPAAAAGAASFTSPPEREITAAIRMTALRELMEFMSTLRGRRKAVVLLSEGLGVNMFSVIDGAASTASRAGDIAREAMRAALRGNVAVYPIDPSGLSPDGAGGESETAPEPVDSNARDSLRAIADVTGGFALVNSNNFSGAFDRLVRENSTYYILGYYSTDDRRDGRYRSLTVRVRRPGLQVRARDGYLAPTRNSRAPAARTANTAGAAVADAVASPLAVSGLPMRVFAAPFKGDDGNAAVAVAVEIEPRGVDLTERDGTFTGRVEVVHAATSITAKVFPGDRHHLDLMLKPDTYARFRARGMRVLLEPQLPPGRYQLRVATGLDDRAGSVVYDLEVPDFSKDRLMMSGVALTSAAAAGVLTVRPANPLAGILPAPITAARVFDAGDTLMLFAEVYENARSTAVHTVDLRAELRADDGRVVASVRDERSSSELAGTRGGYGFLASLSLNGVSPGIYVVHVEARANVQDLPTVSRDVQIRVRDSK